MIKFKRWMNYMCGLELHPDLSRDKRHNENGILFLAHLIMLKSELGELSDELKASFKFIVADLRAYNLNGKQIDGCYDRGILESKLGHETGEFVRNVSHDNITGILCGSLIAGYSFHKDIQKFGAANNGLYDNVSIDKPRFLHKNHKDEWTTTLKSHTPLSQRKHDDE